MNKTKPSAASPAATTKHADWTPRKITYPSRISGVFGGISIGLMSLPAITMHIDACHEARREIVVHPVEARQ